MSAVFVLQKNQDGTFGFIYQTESGQVLLTSRCYGDAETAQRHMHSALSMARKDRNYELRTAQDGGFYFALKNNSKELLGFSPLYPDQESLQQGMDLTRGCSHGARVENPFKVRVQKIPNPARQAKPSCPTCGSVMVLKVAKRLDHPDRNYWGCAKYPQCKGTLEYNPTAEPEPQPF